MKKRLYVILIGICCIHLSQAQRLIHGVVHDPSGALIIGANVYLKGLPSGTVSDQNGRFNLSIPDGANVLICSFTGFQTREIQIDGSDEFDIQLDEGVFLETAVVTALGIKRDERSLGYSVARLNGDEISNIPAANIVNLLSGRAAGVMVLGSNGGNLGGSSRITIRGLRSMNGDNQPLFVVDGVPMDNSNFTNLAQIMGNGSGTVYESQRDYGNAIQDLNPEDIGNINILKGQAAAALYGSRGANGVVMITTKQGSKNRKGIGISVSSSVTFDKVAIFPKFQNIYGGGVDLLPRGYSDNSGYYKIPFIEFDSDSTVIGNYKSFDLVPIYGVDESSGAKFLNSTDNHFNHLSNILLDEQRKIAQYVFPNGFGSNQNELYFRDWNSWDSWDTEHFGKSRLWQAGDDPVKFFETGVTSNQSIAFEGGTEKSNFRLAYTRYDQKGIYPNSLLGRNTISFNGNMKLSDQLNAFVGVNYINSSNKGRTAVTYDFRGGFNPAQNFSQWWHTDLRFADLMQYKNPDGSMRTWNRQSADNPRPQYWDNPYWSRYKNYETDGRNRVFGNAGLSWNLNSWLSLTGRVLTDFYDEQREERIAFGSLLNPQYTREIIHVSETNADCILKAEKNITDHLSLQAFAGTSKLWRIVDRDFGTTIGGMNIPDIYRLQNSKERPLILNSLYHKQIESFFGGASLGWKEMLYLDLTGRQDWSSTLPDDSNGYFYPSISLSYIFSELIQIPNLTFGKLRLGWAKVGSDTDPYNVYQTYNGNPNFGSYPNYTVSNTLNNLHLRPENTTSIEMGMDLRFFKNRLGLDLTFYTGRTKNQIIPLATSASTGFDKQFINAGEISNKGIELALHAQPILLKDFNWELSINFGKNTNRVESILPEDPNVTNLPLASPGGITINAFIGQPYGTILGTNYIYDKDGNKLIDPNTGTYLVSPGVMPIGNTTPDFTGGIQNTCRYKNLNLTVFIDIRKGGDIYSFTNIYGRYSGLLAESAIGDSRENGIVNNGILAVLDNDQNPILEKGGDTQDLSDDVYRSSGQKSTLAVSYQDNKYFDSGLYINKRDLYDGSFIKLREISLGYNVPGKWLKNMGIKEASIAFVARNVAILHKKIPNIDPEQAISTSNISGNEGGSVPSTRSLGFNFNFKF